MATLQKSDIPLFRFNEDRPQIIDEVTRRAYNTFVSESQGNNEGSVGYVLNEAAYMEIERLENDQTAESEVRGREWWIQTAKRLNRLSETEKCELLKKLTETYVKDITGYFRPWTYEFSTRAVSFGLGMLFKAQDIRSVPEHLTDGLFGLRELRDLSDRVVLDGPLDKLRSLAQKGTLIVVPTHSSNLDSVMMGWSLYDAGLPPVTYGAGKNLFTNPVMSFFMNRLGAYKVDRRLKHDLYKTILKIFSEVVIERGYHSLFFPGGGRSRSNRVEDDLKLGLLGTSLTAYINNLQNTGQEHPIFVCPVTINYNLVLEAESLIKDHLRKEGGKRYFLEDDEFLRWRSIYRFITNTMTMSSTTVIRFGEPMDVFGNRVDKAGISYDQSGRRVDRVDYVRRALTGEICHDRQRDREYTRQTGRAIADSYHRNTVVMPTTIVAYVLFELLRYQFPDWDLYKLFRLANDHLIRWYRVRELMGKVLKRLETMEEDGTLRLSKFVRNRSYEDVLEEGLDYLQMYHVPEVIETLMNGAVLHKLDLLYYYSNRLRPYEIDVEPMIESIEGKDQ